jgi:hypothetical protein
MLESALFSIIMLESAIASLIPHIASFNYFSYRYLTSWKQPKRLTMKGWESDIWGENYVSHLFSLSY